MRQVDTRNRKNKEKCFSLLLGVVIAFFLMCSSSLAQRFKGSIAQQDSLLQIEQRDSLYILRAIALSRQLHQENHDAEKEYFYINRAIDRALTIKDTLLYARALDAKGLLYRFHQWYGQAVPLHIRAYELVEDKGERSVKNRMIYANNAGVAARYNQQQALAVEYYLKALKLSEEHDDLRDIAIASNGLGNALSYIPGREEEALYYFKKAMEAEKRRDNSLGLAMNLLSISGYYIEMGRRNEAFENLQELKTINETRKDTFGLALTDAAYGQAYEQLDGDFEKAKAHYQKALNTYRKINDYRKEARTLELLGNLEFKRGYFEDALQYYNRVLTIARAYGHRSFLQKSHRHISEIKEKQQRYGEALQHLKLAQVYKDSIDLANQEIKIEAIRHQYDLTAKEDQIALLQKDQALKQGQIATQEQKIKEQRIFTLILLLIVVLIAVLIIAQYRRRKERRLADQRLQQKEKLLLQAEYEKNMAQAEIMVSRLQINPHFMFNCLGAIQLLIQKKENKKAQKYLTTFSRFIRMVLEIPNHETISLAEELKLIRYYLELENKRFGEEMEFAISAPSDTDLAHVKIPPLLLQPFVENAIWHGLLLSTQPHKKLSISICKTPDATEITIEDNGVGLKAAKANSPTNQKTKRKSLGMKITKERIRQFNQSYNMEINLRIADKFPDHGTCVDLIIKDKKRTHKTLGS